MLKKFTIIAAFGAALGIGSIASASTFSGRVTNFSPTSISVLDREVVTAGLNNDTVFTKLITAKPWQEDTALTAKALRVGAFVIVHVPDNSGFVANWVQVGGLRQVNYAPFAATPLVGYTEEGLKHLAEANARRANPTASDSKRPGAVDTAGHCDRMAALNRTAAIGAPPANEPPANAEAARHRAEATRLRANPNPSESKRPGSPGTASHCDRLANELENASK